MKTGRPITPEETRFFRFVQESGDCWIWTGTASMGYGSFRLPGDLRIKAHRWSYEFFRADIPAGLEIDHLCRNKLCVNPWHLEPVTAQVNCLRSDNIAGVNGRKTHCIRGHAFDDGNTMLVPGGRKCRTCQYAAQLRWRNRKAS